MLRRIPRVVLASVLVAAPLAPLAGPAPADAKTWTVKLKDIKFKPPLSFVERGDTVKWVHDDDGTPHTVTFIPESCEKLGGEDCDSSPNWGGSCLVPGSCMTGGDTFFRRINKVGTFYYYCKLHGTPDKANCAMCGRIKVPAPQSTSSPSATPTKKGSPTATASPSPTVTASTSASPSGSPRASVTPTSPPPLAKGKGNGDSGRIAVAGVAVAVLGGAGYLIYRRMIA